MSPALARLLTRMYPHEWRERYGDEFEELLQAENREIGAVVNVVWAALREHVSPRPGLKKVSGPSDPHDVSIGKAPWLALFIAPLAYLFLGYLAACSILWSGWRMFLPASLTPFVPIGGAATFYFGFGRALYFGSPFLVGWAIAFRAGRHRSQVLWPAVGLLAVALVGGAAHVNAARPSLEAVGNVSMDLSRLPFFRGSWNELLHSTSILVLTGLPLLIWRSRFVTAISSGQRPRGPLA